MKKEDAIHILTAMKKSYLSLGIPDPEAVEALEMAINAVKAEPCEDAISREVILDYVNSHIQEINTGYGDLNQHTNRVLRMIVDYIEKIPSVNPVKTGHWERVEKEEKYCVEYWYECSECHGKPLKEWGEDCLSNYCPYCGAKMEKEEKP